MCYNIYGDIMNYQIRKLNNNDAESAIQLCSKEYQLHEAKDYAMEHRNWVPTSELLLDENISYGAFIDNRLVGFITMADNFIRLLYVDDDFHGLGIGTSLINEACSTIDLDYISTCSTLYAHDFYKKLGFVDTHGLVNDERGYVYYPMEKNVRVDVRK